MVGAGSWRQGLGRTGGGGLAAGGEGCRHQQVHKERMMEFMSADGVWSGGFADCSKRVQSILIYQIGRNAWGAGILQVYRRLQGCGGPKIYGIPASVADGETGQVLDELQTMPSKTIAKCIPKDILTKFKQRHVITDEDLKDFTRHPSSPQPLILAGHKDKKNLAEYAFPRLSLL